MAGRRTRGAERQTLWLTRGQAADALYHAFDSLRSGSRATTRAPVHVRDAISVRRIAVVFMLALAPTTLLGVYNAGLQIQLAVADGATAASGWRNSLMAGLYPAGMAAGGTLACLLSGALYFLPLLLVAYAAARLTELVFVLARRDQLSPGSWVVALSFALLLPVTTPPWQAALAMVFGVAIGREIFGGSGRQLVNPVLLAWAFLFVAYPASLSGEAVWVPVSGDRPSWLGLAAEGGSTALRDLSWTRAFLGFSPGAVGQTSAAACLAGLAVLLAAGVVSWRVVLAFVGGSAAAAALFAAGDPAANPLFGLSVGWHAVLGGWAFALAFLVTDPVTGAHTRVGRWLFGLVAGAFVIVARVLNPIQLEAMPLALLFVSLFAALMDHGVIAANVRRRKVRDAD